MNATECYAPNHDGNVPNDTLRLGLAALLPQHRRLGAGKSERNGPGALGLLRNGSTQNNFTPPLRCRSLNYAKQTFID